MKNKTAFIFTLTFSLLIFMVGFNINSKATVNLTRINGTDRYDTAVKIAQSTFSTSDYVVIASGENYPDALSATTLSKKYNAPILLTRRDSIADSVLQEINALGAKTAFIIGGTGAVSAMVEQSLMNMNLSINRIQGQNRYETSAQIAQIIGTQNGVIIASGENFPDALSISSIAAITQMPILLTSKATMPDAVRNYINSSSIDKFYVVGGTGAVSDNAVSNLNNVIRLTGKDRYQTNLAIINEFKSIINLANLYIATGDNFADALSGSQVAASTSSPILLTDKISFANQSFVKENLESFNSYTVFGGIGAVPETIIQKLMNPTATGRLVLGYATYYYSGDSSSYNSMVSNYPNINEIATHTYSTDGYGNLTGMLPTNQLNFAKDKNIPVYAMIDNGFNAKTAKAMLESQANRQNLINNTLIQLKANNFSGVNVDIEGIYNYNREHFSTFMEELSTALHRQGYTVTVAVPAKTRDSLADSWTGGYDYSRIAKAVDRVVIMTYDEHYSGGTPGPIASIGWVQRVVNYAVTVIPREKIVLGVAAYAYDWSTPGKTKAYGINGAYNVAASRNATVQWDDTSKSPYFTYVDSGVPHTVWFENSTSLSYKLDIVNNYNLAGIAIWRLGLENSDYWATINNQIK